MNGMIGSGNTPCLGARQRPLLERRHRSIRPYVSSLLFLTFWSRRLVSDRAGAFSRTARPAASIVAQNARPLMPRMMGELILPSVPTYRRKARAMNLSEDRPARSPAGSCSVRGGRAEASLHLLDDLLDVEARRLLPRRKVFKRRNELCHKRLCRHGQEGVLNRPIPIGV
jgi:hypothetical protein